MNIVCNIQKTCISHIWAPKYVHNYIPIMQVKKKASRSDCQGNMLQWTQNGMFLLEKSLPFRLEKLTRPEFSLQWVNISHSKKTVKIMQHKESDQIQYGMTVCENCFPFECQGSKCYKKQKIHWFENQSKHQNRVTTDNNSFGYWIDHSL